MIYIFTIIFSVIQCKFVKYNINEYFPSGYIFYINNNGERRYISSFNEYLYSKTLELEVSKNYDIKVYFKSNYETKLKTYHINTSLLMQLNEYNVKKKNNNDFNIMFSPKGLNDYDDKKFFEFLKNNNFPKILIISNNNGTLFNLDEIYIYEKYNYINFFTNEFISVNYSRYRFYNKSDDKDILLTYRQLYSLENNMMFYVYNVNSLSSLINIDSAEFAKFILEKINKTEDNREQFKSIPKVFFIVGEYKLNSISTSIFVKAGFSYSFLDSENYYLIFFKTNANFQPIKTEVKEYNSTNFVSLTTFGENNSQMTK